MQLILSALINLLLIILSLYIVERNFKNIWTIVTSDWKVIIIFIIIWIYLIFLLFSLIESINNF